MNKIDLSGAYSLGLLDDSQYSEQSDFRSLEALREQNVTVIPSEVPSNFELDMQRAGMIPELRFGRNLLKAQELEMMHLFYSKTFQVADLAAFSNPYLVFEGIDTFAEIYLNGRYIGSTDNMLIEHQLKAQGLRQGENELFVHITPVAIKAREYSYPMGVYALKYNFDNLQTRKSNFMAGWDIFPRIMSGGIWKDVSLVQREEIRIAQSYLFTNKLEQDYSTAWMELYYELDLKRERYADYEILVEGACGDRRFTCRERLWSKAHHLSFPVENPKLWWPKGSGSQNLYEVTVSLLKNGVAVDKQHFRTGIRTVALDRTSTTTPEGDGEFCFRVNNRKIFILGTNWVPLDSYPSQGKGKIAKALELVDDIGCNMIRVWGGGYYEDPLFFDICDEKGFLVWQDFMMGCGMYPMDGDFMKRMEEEAVQVVQKFRQHPCLALWAGDNECDCCCEWAGGHVDPNDNRVTRELLPRVIRNHDYVRPYLPSSPYMDEESFRKGTEYITENHLWGPRDYFKSDFYRNAVAHFASEIGYHGCPAPSSIRKFISEEALWPYENNGEWLLHASSVNESLREPYAYRIALMANQIKVLFGSIPDTLENFALLSQISQAEAKKYFIERFRIGKWKRTGLIWWNILDGCPQFSDAVVDYYFNKKLAYYYIKQSQQRVCMMFDEPADGKLSLYAANDTQQDVLLRYRVTDLKDGRVVGEGESLCTADSTRLTAQFPEPRENTVWFIEWTLDGKTCHNHYACGPAPFDAEEYVRLMQKTGFNVSVQ